MRTRVEVHACDAGAYGVAMRSSALGCVAASAGMNCELRVACCKFDDRLRRSAVSDINVCAAGARIYQSKRCKPLRV